MNMMPLIMGVLMMMMMAFSVKGQLENATVAPLDPCFHQCQPEDNGLFAEGCCESAYCQCYGGHGFPHFCEDGQIFNEALQTCDWAWHVPCCNATTEIPTTPPTESCQANTCEEEGFFPEGDCEPDFCQCVGGIGHLLHCQDGLFYNQNTNVCDWPWNNPSCGGGILTTPGPSANTTTTLLDGMCTFNCTEENGEFAEGCCESTFCSCFQGEGFLQHCPDGSVFNEEEGFCDEPETVPCCQTSTLPPTVNTTLSPTVNTTSSSNSTDQCGLDCTGHLDGAFAEGCCLPNYCVCDGGTGLPHMCYNGSFFDAIAGFCHNAANIACCQTTTLPPTVNTTSSSNSTDECGLDCTGHLDGAYGEGCCLQNYCVCDGGLGLPHMCNNGTVFDEITGFCHNPANVACCEGANFSWWNIFKWDF